jgi:hypothetical protein
MHAPTLAILHPSFSINQMYFSRAKGLTKACLSNLISSPINPQKASIKQNGRVRFISIAHH